MPGPVLLRASAWSVGLLLLTLAPVTSADAEETGLSTAESFGAVTDTMLAQSVRVPQGDGVLVPPGPGVLELEQKEKKGATTVVTLSSDILFKTDSADLSAAARSAIGRLLADVPRRARVQIDGHTDSVGTAAHNKGLSLRRAKAVAAAVRAARPDLELSVHGYGETRLKVTESGEDIADDRRQNRRVELTYRG